MTDTPTPDTPTPDTAARNRWVKDLANRPAKSDFHPSLPSIEVRYLTDPDALAAVLPPPLEPTETPRVHVRVTDIDLKFGDVSYIEKVGYFAVDCRFGDQLGEYPLIIPIDLEPAIAISRERFGEPKKLAEIDFERAGDHLEARVTRQGVTFIEIVGDIVETLPTPAPHPAAQFWFKFQPSVTGVGFDGDPLLIQVDQVRSPELVQRVEGKLVLRDSASAPVVDLPVVEIESIVWTQRTSTHEPRIVGPVDADAFEPYAYARYDMGV